MNKLFLEERYDFGEGFVDGGGGANRSMDSQRKSVNMDDLLVFFALESLGTLAIVGNCCLVVVLLRNRYLQRASFVLMLSLALADILHGIVTTSFFYPPIVLRRVIVPSIGVRIFNIIDWTAWSITLTHMSAICLDRLLAITLYGQYSQLITVRRAKLFTVTCWTTFWALNTVYILARFCCLISPLAESHFYTFGYGEFESHGDRLQSPLRGSNLFKLTYTPLELCTLAVLSISNPITFIQLYRRHKRKMALKIRHSASTTTKSAGGSEAMIRRASTMLLEMSMRMGSKHVSTELHEVATRRANRQQQRILFQISVVAIIFYLYMSAYYLLYHVFNVSNKWLVLFNSFFYSTTHMINPVIYFSFNKDMRAQLIRAIADCLNWACCVGEAAGLSRFGGIHSSIYGRGSRRTQPGAESSSGGSVLLHKSSYGAGCMTEANSSVVQTEYAKSGWSLRTYRPPPPSSAVTAKRSFGPLLSPTFSGVPTERTAMLVAEVASTTVPHSHSSYQSPFIVVVNSHGERRSSVAEGVVAYGAPQCDDDNNNRPANGIGRQCQPQKLANLARTLANAATGTVATAIADAERLEIDEAYGPRSDSFGGPPAVGEPPPPPLQYSQQLIIDELSSRSCAQLVDISTISYVDEEDDDDDQSMMGAEQLELQLVDSWNMEEDDDQSTACAAGPLRHKDTLARLGGGANANANDQRLGLFLAERLALGLERSERAAAQASRQRNSLLDALISALILSEESGDSVGHRNGKEGELCQDELQLNNKLRRVCRDQERNSKRKNGLLLSMANQNNNNNNLSDHDRYQDQGNHDGSDRQQQKKTKSRSMDLLQQKQQRHTGGEQRQIGAVQQMTTAIQQPNGFCVQQRQQNSVTDSQATSSSFQPMSVSSSSVSSWKRRRRGSESGTKYVPLRESECDKSADEEEDEDEDEDVIFL